LDAAIRDVLNQRAPRRMAVLKPLKVIIENYPEGRVEEFAAPNQESSTFSGMRLCFLRNEIVLSESTRLSEEAKPLAVFARIEINWRPQSKRQLRLSIKLFFVS